MAQTVTEVYRLLKPFIQRQINEAAGGGRGRRPDVGHTHTDAFYTEAEVNALLAGYGLIVLPLSQFSPTTSAELAGVISDETGTGLLVFATSPTLITPVLGVASATSLNAVAAAGGTIAVGVSGKVLLDIQGNDSLANIHLLRSQDSGVAPSSITLARTRGTNASPTVLATGEHVGAFRFNSIDTGGTERIGATLLVVADGAPGATFVPMALTIYTANAAGVLAERARWSASGNFGLLTTLPTFTLSMGGNAARTIGMERHTTPNTAGNPLTIQSGPPTAAATDKPAGDLILTTGVSTGTGGGKLYAKAPAKGATGTADNALVNRVIINGVVNLTTAVAATVATVAVGALQGGGGHVVYSVFATNGTDIIEASGQVAFSIVNKAGVYFSATSVIGAEAQALSDITDTIANTWAFAAASGNLQITSTIVGLTATTFRITYTVISNGNQDLTVP